MVSILYVKSSIFYAEAGEALHCWHAAIPVPAGGRAVDNDAPAVTSYSGGSADELAAR